MAVNLKIDRSDYFNSGRTESDILATIDFADWDFYPETCDELKVALGKIIRHEMAEAFRNTIRSDPPDIEFCGTDIVISINIGSNWNDGRIWFTASLMEMIDDYIRCYDGKEIKIELAKCLRDCANKLDNSE